MKVNDIAYLCGYFSTTVKDVEDLLWENHFWTPDIHTPEETALAGRFYFPEFVGFCHNQVKTYRHECAKEIKVSMRDGATRSAELTDISVYLYPFGIVMYSIGVRQKDVQLPDALAVLMGLRMSFDPSQVSDFVEYAVKPLMELATLAGAQNLLESGNKFRIFHVVVADGEPASAQELDRLLFSAGTLTMYEPHDNMAFAEEYYEKLIADGKLSVFRNWSALALLDIFTIFSYSPKPFMLEIWTKDYFGKLYMYTLFRKFFLFRLNHLFRARLSSISRLKGDLETFDRSCTFPIVSYNFLPELVVRLMEGGLGIEDEKEKISVMVNQEKERKEAETGDKMNLFLGIISALTLFSAIWDFSCLMDGLFVFGNSIGTVTGFRACTMLILGIICLVILLTRRYKR